MAGDHLEREQKFDVPSGFAFPGLGESEQHTYDLRAVYYDTDDALLQYRGVTLRRRVGGKDDGWHLKVPHDAGRTEIHVDSDATDVPEELLGLTRGLRWDRPLRERAVLRTTREAHELLTNERGLVAEVADDRVEADVASTGETHRWREIEVELGPAATDGVAEELAARLLTAGATPSGHGSKLARAVGAPPPRPALPGLAGLVDDYLQTQYDRLAWGDLGIRRGEEVVHRTRVAVRRIRSTLRVFAPLFGSRAAYFDGELSWYADELGRVRDLGVIRRIVLADLADGPDGLLPREAESVLGSLLEEEAARAREQLLAVLDSQRYRELLHEIDRWRREAPMTSEAEAPAKRVARYVGRAENRSDKRLRKAGRVSAEERDVALHRARKAAKRTRYAAELARPEMGKAAKRIAKAHERRQEGLGAVQDDVMVIATLRHVVATRPDATDLGFLCGVLAQRHARRKSDATAAWR